jgi:hypothetical protein
MSSIIVRSSLVVLVTILAPGCDRLNPFGIIEHGAKTNCFKNALGNLVDAPQCQPFKDKVLALPQSSCLAGQTALRLNEIRNEARIANCIR